MTLQGIDVSAYQGANFNWNAYRGRIGFAGVKISEGTTYADPDALRNVTALHALDIPVIGYHFLHNGTGGQGGAPQAEWFLKCAAEAGLRPGHDLMAADVEDGGLGDVNRNSAADVEQALLHFDLVAAGFGNEVASHYRPGYWPGIYTEISIAPKLVHCGKGFLWLANPSGRAIKSIGPWRLVSFEQTGQKGVDTDVFCGSAGDLAKLAFSK